jgi:hypothetical protein
MSCLSNPQRRPSHGSRLYPPDTGFRHREPKHTAIPRARYTTVTGFEEGNDRLVLFAVEDRTEAANRLHEAHIEIERRRGVEEELRKAIPRGEMLMREIDHRVKNKLFLIESLIAIESETIADPKSSQILAALRSRVWAIASLHGHLYRSSDANGVELDDYFEALARTMFDNFLPSGTKARLEVSVVPRRQDPNTTLRLGLIATELITNSIK